MGLLREEANPNPGQVLGAVIYLTASRRHPQELLGILQTELQVVLQDPLPHDLNPTFPASLETGRMWLDHIEKAAVRAGVQ